MNEYATVPSFDDAGADLPVPPQVLARWAAIASERACYHALLPSQLQTV